VVPTGFEPVTSRM